jgi:hypothetical protein
MSRWSRVLRRLIAPKGPAEVSRVIVGSTGSGKSEGELVDLVRLAERGDCAVVLLDGHGPLAFAAAGHWAARGHEGRLVYEPLDATDSVLAWDMLPRSAAADPRRRRLEDAQTREDVAQCFMAQRNLGTLADKPWTREWLDAALALCLSQPGPEPLTSLLSAFRPRTPDYERLLRGCRHPDVAAKFAGLERTKRRNEVQYETLTGASRRLVELVCDSEVVRLRARPGPFDWLDALRARRLVALDGGAIRAREVKRTLFLLASMQVIHAVRRHFAETRNPLPVVLVLEEAGALGLVTPFVLAALQELRKAGLAIHLLTQSCLDFGDPALFESVLANAPWQCWYQVLSPADQELGGRALTNAAFDARAVQFTRVRAVPEDESLTSPWHTRVRQVIDPYYKSPALQEQEFRTRLATLRVGERLVRDRRGVRRERVRMLRPPTGFADATRVAIARVRRQPLYLPPPPEPPPAPSAEAAARLRERTDPPC